MKEVESFQLLLRVFGWLSFQASNEQRIQFLDEINAPKVILKSTFTVSYF